MAKAFEDLGHATAANKPLRLKRYDIQSGLPDAAQCVDCAILVNDRTKPSEPARLAIATGSGWDFYQREGGSTALVAQPAQHIDLTELARSEITKALPQVLAQVPKLIQAPAQLAPQPVASDDVRVVAGALETLSDHVTFLLNQNAELMARVDFLEKHALGRVTLKETA